MTPAGISSRSMAGWQIRLPRLLRKPRNPFVYWIYWGPFIAAYQVANRCTLREPVVLPATWLDERIPFVPEFLPLYVAYLPLYRVVIARLRDDDELNRAFYGAHLQLAVSLVFFVLLPTRMPRELFYPATTFGWADQFWRWFDGPNACFPSLHTSNCLLLIHFCRDRPYFWIYTSLLVGVIGSTVLVKQHVVIDLVGGALVYLLARAFLARLELTPGLRERDGVARVWG